MGKIKNIIEGRKGNPFLTLLTLLVIVLPALFLMSIQAQAAAPWETWNSVSPPPTTGPINAVTYGDGKTVAVGGGNILTSTNGVNGSSWISVDLGIGINLNAITYGKSMFVAVGDGPKNLYTSSDGYTWTPRTSGTTANLKGIAYGNGTFVAAGDDGSGTGVIISSSDGISWGTYTVPGTMCILNAITYDANIFVAVGEVLFVGSYPTAAAFTSPDGENWTIYEIYPSMPSTIVPKAVTYGNGYFVAVATGRVFYSLDGEHWVWQGAPYYMQGIANAYLIFVAVGDGGSLVTFSDPDPLFWTSQVSGTTNNLSGVTFGDDARFFVVGEGTVLYSDPFGMNLTVTKPGLGTGTVRSLPPGINCGSDCNEHYDAGTVVTVTAAPATGSYFAGWSGDCVSSALTCKVTMNAAKNVSAVFTDTPPPVTTWAKTYGSIAGNDSIGNLQQTSDGGYIGAGSTSSFGAGLNDAWVMKFNSGGTVAWQKTYGGSKHDSASSIQETSDGRYIIAGYTYSFAIGGVYTDAWVLKLNGDGTVAWQKTYGGSIYDYAHSAQETSDGGYIVVGETSSFGAGDYDVWVLKLNSDGTVAWQKTYGGSGFEVARRIQQTSDGGYIVAGHNAYFVSGTYYYDAWVMKLDGDGTVAWQKNYDFSDEDIARGIQQTSDGGYIVTGETRDYGAGGNYDAWVMKLNGDGTVAWQKTYGGSDHEYAWSIQQTSDGGYIVAAQTGSFGAGNYDAWVLKLTGGGTVAWQKTYGGLTWDSASSIKQTSDGGYIMGSGIGTYISPDYVWDAWVLKLDSNGDILGCPGGLIGTSSAVVGTPTITVTTPIPTIGDTSATVNDTSVPPGTTTVTPGEVCATFLLSVSKTGSGNGIVTSDLPGISCGSDCAESYTIGTLVLLTATPDPNSVVAGWSGGGCSGTGPVCVVAMTADTSVVKVFLLSAGDSDGDGLPDGWEITNFGNLDQGASDDPDNDGFTNSQEYEFGTNPNLFDPDTDGDGIPDSVDNCPGMFNPVTSWIDKNGISHNSQPDFDLDGIGDACDPDADGDGYNSIYYDGCDCNDLNPSVYPGDGICPATCGQTARRPPSCTDCDSDGVLDTSDNCPTVKNGPNEASIPWVGNQTNSDGDSYGDACDTCPDVTNPDQSLTVWYKDYDNDLYSDGTSVTSCRRPKVCSTNQNVVCKPVTASHTCTEPCGGSWVEMINGGYAYKKATGDGLIATSGDCDDSNINRNSGKTEIPNNGIDEDCNTSNDYSNPYNIVFDMGSRVCSGNADVTCISDSECSQLNYGTCVPLYDKWLPKDGVLAAVTARVTGPSGEVSPVTFTFTFAEVTNYQGKYTNDATPDTNPPGDDFACAPVACRSLNGTQLAGNLLNLTPLDFGGRIKISVNAKFYVDGGATPVDLTKDLTMPKDLDDDHLADSWEMEKFGNLNHGPDEHSDGDGLSNFKEYRGFYWGKLDRVEPQNSNGLYKTVAYVPQAGPSHFRTDPNRRDLFVKYTGYPGNLEDTNNDGALDYPGFAIGVAFYNAGIDVHAVDSSAVIALGDANIDVVEVTNWQTGTHLSEDGRTWKQNIRNWSYATMGYSNPPIAPNYGMGTRTYQVALDHYFNDKSYYDGGDSCNGPISNKLENINTVQDYRNDNGINEKFGNQWEAGCQNCLFTSDSVTYVYFNGWYLAPATPLTCSGAPVGLSSNDIDKNGKTELPMASDPINLNRNFEYTKQHVLKHLITHEIGHSVGASHQTAEPSCIMLDPSINWSRDDHFSDYSKAQLNIHNQ